MHRRLLSSVLLGTFSLAAACKTSVSSSGAGGAGAAGNTGATGGSTTDIGTTGDTTGGAGAAGGGGPGGGGGSTSTDSCSTTWSCGPECTAEEAAPGPGSFTLFAPDNSLFDAYGTMTITAVSPSGFELLASTGEKVVMGWSGPDITAHFAVGDTVEANRTELADNHKWSWVSGNGMVASAWYGPDWGTLVTTPAPAPFGGPTFGLEYACVMIGRTCLTSSYRLQASWGDETAVAATGEIVQVGPFEVQNGGILALDCQGEDSTLAGVTVLGPLAPP